MPTTSKELVDLVLVDAERDAVAELVAGNKLAFGAIKKVLLAAVYFNGTLRKGQDPDPLRNAALSLAFEKEATNEMIGADVRAIAEGIRAIENGFTKLEGIMPSGGEKPPVPKKNRGR